jgi:hypothetical protein
VGLSFAFDTGVKMSPNGISIPADYRNWRIIAPSHRSDNNTIRVILGNDVAIKASRSGKVVTWPDGSILAKIVWKDINHEKWQSAVIPGKFVHAEFMIKDSKKYSSTGGWGFARWKGLEQKPYGDDADFVKECFGCHTPVMENDYVFTKPAEMP